uniref:TraB domain-containing protein n=1 Tax=Panagrolaimus superbus TaxID=310955 RepID=A0A914YH43_9BILA
MSNKRDKLLEDIEMLKGDAEEHYEAKLRADLENISGDIQTVPSMPLITADSQLTEEDIFRMKRLGKPLGASEMQSVASVVDSTSNFGDHVPDDNGSMNSEDPLDITAKDVNDQALEDESPLQNERDIHISICGRYGFNRSRMSVPQFPPGVVTELTFPFTPKNIPEGFSPEEYKRMFSQSKIYLVGTAHFSKSSQDDVLRTIRMTQPDIVMIELCASRLSILSMDDQTLLREAKNLDRERVISLIRESGLAQGILHVLLLSTSAYITRQLGMAPGGEFRAAYEGSLKVPCCRLTLGDRPIQVTFQRALGALGIFQKIRLFYHLILSNGATITPEDVERCKQKDLLEEILREMAGEFPQLSKIFVSERDEYMVHVLQTLLERTTEEKIMAARDCGAEYQPVNIVAVVGIGHAPGIQENWGRKVNIAELLCIPQPSFASKAFKFTLKAAVVGATAYGIYRLGTFAYGKIRPMV